MTITRLIFFISIALAIAGALHVYLWARLVQAPGFSPGWYWALTVALIVLGLLIPIGIVLSRFAPRAIAGPAMWVAYTWLGLATFLFVLLVPVDLVLFVARLFAGDALFQPERRLFLARSIATYATAGSLGLAISGIVTA